MSILFIFTSTFTLQPLFAQDIEKPIMVAQDSSDSFDPFADYSEFEEASEEEADINFFKNGRFFSLGLIVGYRTLTGTLGQLYPGAPNFGINLTYFFDLRFALQIAYSGSTHPFSLNSAGTTTAGSTAVSGVSFDLKYYFNTQNVTKGLASINPYISGGFTQNYLTRTVTVDTNTPSTAGNISKDSAASFNFAVGAEMPLMKGKMYLGLEAQYQFITWPGEGSPLTIGAGTFTPSGDMIRVAALIGVNF